MKHRIQHPENRIQKAESAYGVEDVAGGTPMAATGTVAILGNRREAGGSGKRRYASYAFTALSGCEIGEWCSFSHFETALTRLFPRKSTQVVDFPHLGVARHFLDANFTNERELGKDIEQEETERTEQAKLASKVGRVN